jgi:hypothetical protein
VRKAAAAGPYEVRVQARLDARWASRFDDCTLTHHPDGTTVITSTAVDQAALHGVLQVVRDLGLTLLSVSPVPLDAQQRAEHTTATDPAASSAAAAATASQTSRSRT